MEVPSGELTELGRQQICRRFAVFTNLLDGSKMFHISLLNHHRAKQPTGAQYPKSETHELAMKTGDS